MSYSDKDIKSLHQHYFPHIDGVRTLAVLPIVVYHFIASFCPGGYVGVDIFFVISGYLITLGILNSQRKGHFTIANFYSKRIRRIIPAYGAVVLFVLASSFFIYAGERFINTIQTVKYSSIFASNFFFFFTSGYFEDDSVYNPLLHLWSLSVEEQFYLIIPILMLLCLRKSIKLSFAVLAILTAGSLAASIICADLAKNTFNFFMLPTRAWELLAGSLLAFASQRTAQTRPWMSFAALLGLILCLATFYLYDHGTSFPGVSAIPPVLGAVLLIRYGDIGVVGKLLQSTPFVWVGKISYSLYLWHWPLIVYWNYFSFNSQNLVGISIVLALSFLMAYLSWRYIEMPIRLWKGWDLKKGIIITGALCSFLLVSTVTLSRTPYLGQATGFVAHEQTENHLRPTGESLRLAPRAIEHKHPSLNPMTVLGTEQAPVYILFGDSHAGHLLTGLHLFSQHTGINGYHINTWNNVIARHAYHHGRPNEAKNIEYLLEWLKDQHDIRYVILANRYASRFDGVNNEPPYYQFDLRHAQMPDLRDNAQIMDRGLRELCVAIRAMGKEIIMLTPVPEQGFHVPSYWAANQYSYKYHTNFMEKSMNYEQFQQRTKTTMKTLSALQKEGLIHLLDTTPFFFSGTTKSRLKNQQQALLYSDDDHLSPTGSVELFEYLTPQLQAIMSGKQAAKAATAEKPL